MLFVEFYAQIKVIKFINKQLGIFWIDIILKINNFYDSLNSHFIAILISNNFH